MSSGCEGSSANWGPLWVPTFTTLKRSMRSSAPTAPFHERFVSRGLEASALATVPVGGGVEDDEGSRTGILRIEIRARGLEEPHQ